MALSEIIIKDLVHVQTNVVINEASYQVLRQLLLERKPLAIVTNTINSILSDHCSADRQAFIQYVTQAACESQKSRDDQEAQSDALEQDKDSRLQSDYSQEVLQLQTKLVHIDSKCFQQQNYVSQLRSQLDVQKMSLTQVNSSIQRVRNDRLLFNSSYQYNRQYPHVHAHFTQGIQYPCINVQSHYLQGIQYPQVNVHAHYSQGTLCTNTYPTSSLVYSLQDQLAWESSSREETRLIEEKQGLTRIIDVRDAECTREAQNLNQLLGEKKQMESRLKELKNQLNRELPQKEQQRQVRHQERLVRENARQENDPNLLQLSSRNRETLKQKIASKNNEFNSTKNQLLDEAVKMSYLAFVNQLEDALQGPTLSKIMFHESEALKLIVPMMKKYCELEAWQGEITQSLKSEQSKHTLLQNKLAESMLQLKKYTSSKPELIQKNRSITEENRKLQLDSDSAGNSSTSALFCSLFGGCSSLLTASLVGSLMVSPLYFAIPGVLALFTVISLTVAVVYHFQKSSCDDQMIQNAKTLIENEEVLEKQGKEVEKLSLSTIPGLKNQLHASEQSIALIEKQLKDLNQTKTQLVAKAQNVTETSSLNNLFFSGSNSNVTYLQQPSASPEYKGDDLISFANY